MSIDGKSIWAEVQANSKRLRECQRHAFTEEKVRLGQKLVCQNCGGSMTLTAIGQYIAGYQANGGKASDIWPAYALPSPPSAREEKSSGA